jgi:MSHA biogenesis protein MshO
MKRSLHQRGFTLVELVMVIVIMGVVGSMVAVFMKKPVDAYFDTSRRAAITDVADNALRRMARDLQRALPNSVRNPSSNCIEFIPTRTGGRYRAEDIVAGDGSALDFSTADSRFNMLGLNSDWPAEQQIRAGDRIVVYNLGIAGADAYAGSNTSTVQSVVPAATETTLNIAAKQFPLASASSRFHVIPTEETVVSYVCSGNVLYRNSNYSYASSCPAPTAGTTPVMAKNASACTFVYAGADLQRNALVQMTLALSNPDASESVTLYHEVHVSNTP